MIVSVFILFFFLWLLFRNFERGVITVFVLSTWLNSFTLGFFSVHSFLVIIICFVYILKYHISWKTTKHNPLLFVSFFFLASMFLTNFFARSSHLPQLVRLFFTNIIFVYIIWDIFNKKPKMVMRDFYKTCACYAVVIGIYALIEVITRINPYITIVNSLGAYSDDHTITEIRFGLKRAQSLFCMHTTLAGVAYNLFAVFLFTWLMNYKRDRFVVFMTLLMASTVFFTGARSGIIALAVCSISVAFYRRLNLSTFFFILLFLVISIFLMGDYWGEIYHSIAHSDEDGIGSSQGMREIQFDLAIMFLNQSFWLGNGIGYIAEATEQARDLLGAESMWLPLMIDYGFIGILSYIFFYLVCMKYSFVNPGGVKL